MKINISPEEAEKYLEKDIFNEEDKQKIRKAIEDNKTIVFPIENKEPFVEDVTNMLYNEIIDDLPISEEEEIKDILEYMVRKKLS